MQTQIFKKTMSIDISEELTLENVKGAKISLGLMANVSNVCD